MNRNVKALALAVAAMLAMSALVASAVQAEATTAKFTAGAGVNYPVTLTASTASGTEVWVTEGGTIECASSYHGNLNEASQTLTFTPTYTSCKAFGFLSATVATDGCSFQFHLTTKTGADSYQAHVDIVDCGGPGRGLTVSASTCNVTIPEQASGTTFDIENMTNTPTSVNDITLRPTWEKVKYEVTADGLGCPFSGKGLTENGSLVSNGTITVTAEEKGKTTPVELHVG